MTRPDPIIEANGEDAVLREEVEAARASLRAGRSIPYADVRRWLLSWGTEDKRSAPKCK